MTGISSTLDIAKQALCNNQYAISVTGQNIANVGNAGYSRQLISIKSGDSLVQGGLAFGTGAQIAEIKSACDQTLEKWLSGQQSDLSAYEEMTSCITYIGDIFSTDTDAGLDTLFSNFWNSWSDLSNTPTGSAERTAVYESGAALVAQFNTTSEALQSLSIDLDREIDVAVETVNTLTAQIDRLNGSITAMEAGGSICANDLRDQRQALVSELSSLMEVSTHEQANGALTVTTASGSAILVNDAGARDLSVSGGRILWEGSAGPVDITDRLSGGSIGGWLDIRDETVPTYQAQLDALSETLIWNVNHQHSQGVGLTFFSGEVTGSYPVDESGLLSTLSYADNIDTSRDFKMWIENTNTDPATFSEVVVDLSGAAPVSAATMTVGGIANCAGDTYVLKVAPPGASIGDGSDVTVTWTGARTAGAFTVAAGDTTATATVDGMDITFSGLTGPFEGDTFVITTDADGVPFENVSSYTLEDFAQAFNTAATAAGGGVTASVAEARIVFSADSPDFRFAFGDDGSTGYSESGLAAALGVNTFFTGSCAMSMGINETLSDADAIAAGKVDAQTGSNASGDNSNALLLSECGNVTVNMARWTFARGDGAATSMSSSSTDTYYQTLIASLGIESASIDQRQNTAAMLMNSLQERRDSLSAVSLDEEMINLVNYQNAYSAASKLLSITDEMLDTLLSLR